METKPTIDELEAILRDEAPGTVAITPNGEVRTETLKEKCDRLRKELLVIETEVRALKLGDDFTAEDSFPGQRGEMIAQATLAFRYLEEARMRLGKVLQWARDGVSINDRP